MLLTAFFWILAIISIPFQANAFPAKEVDDDQQHLATEIVKAALKEAFKEVKELAAVECTACPNENPTDMVVQQADGPRHDRAWATSSKDEENEESSSE
jgi:hypothetical protein